MAALERLKGTGPLQVALRTYTLALSLSLFPALLPVVTSRKARSPKRLFEVMKRELSPTGFAFAMTLAVGGGRALDQLWNPLENTSTSGEASPQRRKQTRRLSPAHKTFLANALSSTAAVMLLTFTRRSRHIKTAAIPLTVTPPPRGSPTLDLTLLLFVRALDAGAQVLFRRPPRHQGNAQNSESKARKKRLTSSLSADLDAVVFWLACSRCSSTLNLVLQPDLIPT